jgi:serine/threonine-protein kinase
LGRFEREAALAQRLRHPNTVVLHDYGSDDGLYYIVYELLEGRSLSAEIRKEGTLPGDRVVHITAQVLRSLAEAHEAGIVHRDIKPANVFLAEFPGERDVVKVLDFGIAKDLSKKEAVRLTKTGYTPGTPRYMAPEQLLGRPSRPAADLYAVGLLMAEMLDGRPVFAGGPLDCVEVKVGKRPTPLREHTRSSPLLPVVQRATERDPDDRYATALEMLAHIETVASTRPSLPAPLTATVTDDDAKALAAALNPLETTVKQRPAISDPPPRQHSDPPPRYSDPPPHGLSNPPGPRIPPPPAQSGRAQPSATTTWLVIGFVAAALLILLGGWVAATWLAEDTESSDTTSAAKRPATSKTSRATKKSFPRPQSTVHELVPLGDQAPTSTSRPLPPPWGHPSFD